MVHSQNRKEKKENIRIEKKENILNKIKKNPSLISAKRHGHDDERPETEVHVLVMNFNLPP